MCIILPLNWTNSYLALAALLGIVDGIERIVEYGGADHDCDVRFSMARRRVRYLQ